MSDWNAFLADVSSHSQVLDNKGCHLPLFRGHTDSRWPLLHSLGRQDLTQLNKQNIDSIPYYDFMSQAGQLFGKKSRRFWTSSSQCNAKACQQDYWPGRSLAPAADFAICPCLCIKEPKVRTNQPLPTQPCVWILNSFEPSLIAQRDVAIANPSPDCDASYQENFIEGPKQLGAKIAAMNPPERAARQVGRRSVLTRREDLTPLMEVVLADVVKKSSPPDDALLNAIEFLALTGANTLFPDLDDLARLKQRVCAMEIPVGSKSPLRQIFLSDCF